MGSNGPIAGEMAGNEIEAAVDIVFVQTDVGRFQIELLAMHRRTAAIGDVGSCAHPMEIAGTTAAHTRVNVGGLRHEFGMGYTSDNGLRQALGRRRSECLIDVREMLAVKLVKIGVVGGVVLGTIPPVPVAALGNEQLFVGQGALLVG